MILVPLANFPLMSVTFLVITTQLNAELGLMLTRTPAVKTVVSLQGMFQLIALSP